MILKIVLGTVALLLLAGSGILVKMKYEQSKMRPLSTGEVIPGIFSVKNDFVNFYLVKSGDKYIAVDAGANRPATEKELQSLGISGDDVAAVLLTHAHGDHTGALGVFNNADVYVGEGGASGKLPKHKVLTDGASIEPMGTLVHCIATPGHSDSSVCYLIDGKYLFTGDTLSLHDGQVGLFNSFFNKSDEMQMESIQKLAALEGVQYIFSAHYGFTGNASFPIGTK